MEKRDFIMDKKYKRLKYACYTVSLSMSVVANLSPILFLTFRSLYGISFSLLGLLVVINFFTQLTVDLIFSFFSHKFNIEKTVKGTPILTLVGLIIYALWPFISSETTYVGLVIGTIIFSAASGLAEVLISPVIAAIPADNPDQEMSKLHSVYAWGVVPVIILSTLFIFAFGAKNWQWLVIIYSVIPIMSITLFSAVKIPEIKTPEKTTGALKYLKSKAMWLFFIAIFLGGAAELTMGQWASSYIEQALNIPKVWGDVFGVALFSVAMGTGRTLYSKIGKNIGLVLLWGSIGATVCYLTAIISPLPIIGLVACAVTGFCVSMLWPGTLIVSSDHFPESGVFIYAIMAAGGDMGASVAPQLVGIVTDLVINNPVAMNIAQNLNMLPEQFGMKAGLTIGMFFPLVSIPIFHYINKKAKS